MQAEGPDPLVQEFPEPPWGSSCWDKWGYGVWITSWLSWSCIGLVLYLLWGPGFFCLFCLVRSALLGRGREGWKSSNPFWKHTELTRLSGDPRGIIRPMLFTNSWLWKELIFSPLSLADTPTCCWLEEFLFSCWKAAEMVVKSLARWSRPHLAALVSLPLYVLSGQFILWIRVPTAKWPLLRESFSFSCVLSGHDAC